MSLIATASILVLLIIIVILFLFHLEQVKYTKRLEDRIAVLSSRIKSMNNKELDTVLKSLKYKQERDELYKLIDDMYNTLDTPEVGEGRTYLFPRAYSDNPNKLKAHRWEDVYLASPSYYSYNPSQANTQTDSNTPSQDSSSYSGGGGDFSGGGSGGSWD